MKLRTMMFLFVLAITGTPFARTAVDGESRRVKLFVVSKGGTLEVSLNGGDVRITTSDKNELTVRTEASDDEGDSELNMSQQGNTIRVSDNGNWHDGGRVDITIPSQFNVNIETSFGDLVVKGKLVGNISGETSAGNITLGDVDGLVDMRTSGGDIRAGKIAGKGSLNTSGGEVDVVSCTGELDLKSSGGDIHVGNVGKSLRAKTAGGDIVIGDVGGEANVSTAGGNVHVGKVLGPASLSTAGGDVELNGGNGTIKASTSGGNIMLMNVSGSVSAATAGGDIHAELTPSGKGRSKLSSSNGVITLYLPLHAKATITARIRIQGGWRNQRHDYKVRSDFKEESSTRIEDEREIESMYILNGGGETISLETVNSDIEIRKLKK